MAVVPGGNFGTFFTQYNQLSNSRNWNTKNYDYATVKNKGEISEDAKNEDPDVVGNPITYGTALSVKVDKNGYFNNGRFISDPGNPTYQIRDKYDRVDNNYYVDQKTGDVYLRPAVSGAGGITLPATTNIDVNTSQNFGTTFNLTKVLNPEDFGGASLNRLLYTATGSGREFTELTVNGVQIAVNGLDTAANPAIPAIPSDALYNFSDSFQTGAEDFTAVHPNNKWVSAYLQWPGAGGSLGVGAQPIIPNTESMWFPDTTDTNYNVAAANATGVTDVLFRRKFTLGATVPLAPINLDIGAADHYDLYINGKYVTAGNWPNSQTLDIQPFLVPGENVIGIHASDFDADEGMYVQMGTVAANKLGTDLSASYGGWEASVGNLNPDDPPPGTVGNISNTFTDPWTYEVANQRYTNSEPGRVLRQSYFNNRTTDNFIMKASLAFLDTTTGNPGQDWAGFQIRGDKPDSTPNESGYTVAVSKNGDVVLYKAHADILLPNPLGLDPITGLQSSAMVAKANIPAFAGITAQNLEIHANGTNIQVGIAGSAPVINWTDQTNHPYTDGYTSFVTYGPHVAYDNFQLYSYTPAIQLLSRALQQGENNIVIKGYDNTAITVNVGAASNFGGVALGTNNLLPNLATTDIMDIKYKASSRVDIAHPDPNELDPLKAYWSGSQNSALGIIGKIVFQNREGGSAQKVKDEFSRVNTVMQDITSLLGASDDLFKSHLNIIR